MSRKREFRMKNLNKVISGVLISSLLFTPVSTLALTKEETVYANLNYNGTVEKTIVNNHISDLDKGKVKPHKGLIKEGDNKKKKKDSKPIEDDDTLKPSKSTDKEEE